MTRAEIIVMLEVGHSYEEYYYSFKAITKSTGLDKTAVRAACRSLASRGYLVFERGLMTEDGELAGSGYGATFEGGQLYEGLEVLYAWVPDCACGVVTVQNPLLEVRAEGSLRCA